MFKKRTKNRSQYVYLLFGVDKKDSPLDILVKNANKKQKYIKKN